MSTLTISDSRLESFSDWVNPILVKETRQALKSRHFVVTFMLLLIASWLICLFGIMIQGAQLEYGSPGTDFFQSFFFVISVAVLIVIPFTAFRSLLTEQDSQTYELLSITSLSPGQIVWGKFLNSVVQICVFYSAITPFIAFTSLLQGFDLIRTLVLLVTLFGVSLLLCMFTLMLSTVARNRQVQTLSSLFIFGGLTMVLSSMIGFSATMMMGGVELDWEFYWGWISLGLIGLSYFCLFLQITISQLKFESANKSTGVRLIATGQFLLVWGVILTYEWLTGRVDMDLVMMAVFFSLLHWGVFCFFIAMERDYLSRRIRREIPKRSLLRLISVPFMPGGARGYLLVTLNLLLLAGILCYYATTSTSSRSDFFQTSLAAAVYLLIYLGIGCWLTRQLLKLSHDLMPMHGRTILIVLFAFGAIFPYVILWFAGYYDSYNTNYQLIMITNPIETLNEISNSGGSLGEIVILLGIGWLVVFCLNLTALNSAIQDIVFPRRPKSPAEV